MHAKLCERCGGPASYSLAFHLSTIGHSRRDQKCSKTSLLCEACIRLLIDGLGLCLSDEQLARLRAAYTWIATRSRERSDPSVEISS